MNTISRTFAYVVAAAMLTSWALQASSGASNTLAQMGKPPWMMLYHRTVIAAAKRPLTTGSASTLTRLAVSGDGAAADVDAVPAPAAVLEWVVSLAAIWIFGLSRIAKARSQEAETLQEGMSESHQRLELLSKDPSHVLASDSPAYRELIDGYERLQAGEASTAEVDQLRREARSLLNGRDEQAQYELRGVRTLLDWLDSSLKYGRITITVQQLRVRKMGKWDMECGITAGVKTATAKMSVAGDMDVHNCSVTLPWDPGSTIKLWMHLSEIGYETCWGHFGPISMSSAEVVQDTSGLLRGFHAEQFDKDFKVAFTIQRTFGAMPALRFGFGDQKGKVRC